MYIVETNKGEKIGCFDNSEQARLYAVHYFVIKTITDYGYLKFFTKNITKSKLTRIIHYAITGACGDLVEAFEVFTRDFDKKIRKEIIEKTTEMFEAENVIKSSIGYNDDCILFIKSIDYCNDLYYFEVNGIDYSY